MVEFAGISPSPVRMVAVWCPEWPTVAARAAPDQPIAIMHANRVISLTPAASRAGVRRGDRRRAAQSTCPELELVPADPERDAREFDPIVRCVADMAPRLEIVEPGLITLIARGPSRYFGGDRAFAERLVATVGSFARVTVGVADGRSAATLAARVAARRDDRVLVVDGGGSASFVGGLPVRWLAELGEVSADLIDLLARLGIHSLGQLAVLDPGDVLARFGPDGHRAHRIASGADERIPFLTDPPPEWWAEHPFDEPVHQLETVVFVAKRLADELVASLAAEGRVCTRLFVAIETEHGERSERAWYRDAGLSAVAMVERVRWQLDGWVAQSGAVTGGVALIRLIPDEVRGDDGVQSRLWGERSRADLDAGRAVVRLSGLAGDDAVSVPVWNGGRLPAERFGWIAATSIEPDDVADRSCPTGEPWPGSLPAPSPTMVFDEPREAEVVGESGRQVVVSGRGELSEPPAALVLGATRSAVVAWAGPWPVDQRWWSTDRRRLARLQVVTDGGVAHLVAIEHQRWMVLATYA